MPYKARWSEVEIPDLDIWSMYMEEPKDYPDDHELLIDGETNRSYTFAQVKHLSASFGRGLMRNFQWQKGDALAFFSPNSIDTPVLNLGLLWAGGVSSPANPTYTPEELARQMKDSGAKALVTQMPFLQTALKAAEQAGLPRERIFLMGDGRDPEGKLKHWSEFIVEGGINKPVLDSKKDLAYLVYSSGTTGLPKGVMLTHFNVVANSYQSRRFDIRAMTWDNDSQLGVLPFFHIYGLGVVLNITFLSGAKCIILPRFNLETACSLIQTHGITFMYVPPPIILAISKEPIVDKYDLSTLRFINSAAAPLSRELVDAVFARIKVGVKQGYGLSETSPTVTTQFIDEWARFQGSVGKLLPNIEAKIVDETGKELLQGEAGELLLKGPNIFSGYWNQPNLNKDTFTADGWYKTGDVMYIDTKGNFYITDRLKELIKYKGFQVPPAELEAKLIGSPKIADVCVVGIWNEDEHTEVPRAYVVPSPGVDASEQLAKEIVEWLNKQVAPPKKLRGGVRFVKEIPKSQSGKILRRVLKEQLKKEAEKGETAKL